MVELLEATGPRCPSFLQEFTVYLGPNVTGGCEFLQRPASDDEAMGNSNVSMKISILHAGNFMTNGFVYKVPSGRETVINRYNLLNFEWMRAAMADFS